MIERLQYAHKRTERLLAKLKSLEGKTDKASLMARASTLQALKRWNKIILEIQKMKLLTVQEFGVFNDLLNELTNSGTLHGGIHFIECAHCDKQAHIRDEHTKKDSGDYEILTAIIDGV